jgi:MarR family transcriptional regulator, 2-MHQ and catechol-resistance regulon repressor
MSRILKERLRIKETLPANQEALLNIFVVHGYLRQKYEQVIGKYNITLPQYNVLRILKGVYPEGHPRCEIISRMIDPNPDVTRLLDKLEKEKYVERFISNEDRRFTISIITKKGLSVLEEMKDEMVLLEKEVMEKLKDDELEKLSELCEKIYNG